MTHGEEDAIVTIVDTVKTYLLRKTVTTVLLAATALVVAWFVLFTGPDMGVNRYAQGQVSNTGMRVPAVQTGDRPNATVVGIQRHRLPSGVPHAQ
jgi:hypothetical protein